VISKNTEICVDAALTLFWQLFPLFACCSNTPEPGLPRGTVGVQDGNPNGGLAFSVLAKLDGMEMSDCDLNSGK
jgi:hypothetical protein